MKGSTDSRSPSWILPIALLWIVGWTALAGGQPIDDCTWQPGQLHKMHWPQLPDLTATGMDVSLRDATLADDFLCTSSGPIRNIHLWASFLGDNVPKEGPESLTVVLSLYSNIAAEGAKWGQPGVLLWRRTFAPGQYTVETVHRGPEDWYNPVNGQYLADNHRQAYQFSFCVQDEPFVQQEGNTYWLAVGVSPLSPGYALGWKSSLLKWRWNQNAVFLDEDQWTWAPMDYPRGHEYADAPMGLAFVITSGDDTTPEHDLGDAPDSTGSFPDVKMIAYPFCSVAGNFPTVYQAGSPPYGPLHRQPRDAFYLGTRVSLESEADLGPDDDGVNNLDPPSDAANQDGADDGLELPVVMPHLGQTRFEYSVTKTSHLGQRVYVNVWCDWNRDGDWNDTVIAPDGRLIPEWVVQDHPPTVPGLGTYGLTTPAFTCWHATPDDPQPIWARITIAEKRWQDVLAAPRVGGAGPATGYQYGETEDYYLRPHGQTTPTRYDWGDAPDAGIPTGYPTLAAHNGARHVIAGPWLGNEGDAPDAENDGRPSANALGDDTAGVDDENGVSIPPLFAGQGASITVQVQGGGGVVQGWIDFDADGMWQSDEQVLDRFLPDGVHIVSLTVPEDATIGQTFARFRISTSGELDPDGPAINGEVEDHEVWIDAMAPNVKWCQMPDLTSQGMDIRVDGGSSSSRAFADDFECTSRDRLTHIRLWGSWKEDRKGEIDLVRIRIHADDPAGPDGADKTNAFSKPGPEILWQKQFGQGAFQESLYYVSTCGGQWWWDPADGEAIPGDDAQIWQLDFLIDAAEAFLQEGSEQAPRIYWLSVEVEATGGQFGWKTRRWPEHFMDDAVWDLGSKAPRPWQSLRYPKGHPYYDSQQNSIDLAFCLISGAEDSEPPVTSRPATITYCPALETMCPATTTKCPAMVTQCPTVETRCPSTETKCPPMPTKCPAVATECPANLTQCPTMETLCPTTETKCPATVTQCPVVSTKCPATETQCRTFPTTCPAVETQCPATATKCPVMVTQCPPVETQCPATATQCRTLVTTCPAVETQCPASATKCPTLLTQCPPTATTCSKTAANAGGFQTLATQACPVVETECLRVSDYVAAAVR